MSSKEERKINFIKLKEVISACANGNIYAEEYLSSIAFAVRVIDDLTDQDYPVSKKDIIKTFFILFAGIHTNPFFITHYNTLIGCHIVAYNAWMDSIEWEREKGIKKLYSHVIRDYINELCPLVAYLTGGYDSMRKISLTVRELFLKEEKGKEG